MFVVCGGGGGGGGVSRGYAGEVVFASGVCAKAPRVQICPKAFVHDCRFYCSVNEQR